MMTQDRRTQRRTRVNFPAVLRARSERASPKAFYGRVNCHACDVSVSGARLVAMSEALVPEGAVVIVKLRPSRFRRTYALKGIVRWGRSSDDEAVRMCGVEFDSRGSFAMIRWHRFMRRFLKKRGVRA